MRVFIQVELHDERYEVDINVPRLFAHNVNDLKIVIAEAVRKIVAAAETA